jgi:hypothetical protein
LWGCFGGIGFVRLVVTNCTPRSSTKLAVSSNRPGNAANDRTLDAAFCISGRGHRNREGSDGYKNLNSFHFSLLFKHKTSWTLSPVGASKIITSVDATDDAIRHSNGVHRNKRKPDE